MKTKIFTLITIVMAALFVCSCSSSSDDSADLIPKKEHDYHLFYTVVVPTAALPYSSFKVTVTNPADAKDVKTKVIDAEYAKAHESDLIADKTQTNYLLIGNFDAYNQLSYKSERYYVVYMQPYTSPTKPVWANGMQYNATIEWTLDEAKLAEAEGFQVLCRPAVFPVAIDLKNQETMQKSLGIVHNTNSYKVEQVKDYHAKYNKVTVTGTLSLK